jgi:IS5 family transposase
VLQALYNLSDDQAEYQLRDRFSFMRFLGLELEDTVPDATLDGRDPGDVARCTVGG